MTAVLPLLTRLPAGADRGKLDLVQVVSMPASLESGALIGVAITLEPGATFTPPPCEPDLVTRIVTSDERVWYEDRRALPHLSARMGPVRVIRPLLPPPCTRSMPFRLDVSVECDGRAFDLVRREAVGERSMATEGELQPRTLDADPEVTFVEFHSEETDPVTGARFRWSKAKSWLRVGEAPRRAGLLIQGWVPPHIHAFGVALRVSRSGSLLATGYSDRRGRIEVFTTLDQEPGEERVLELTVDRTFRPDVGGDSRELGVKVTKVYVGPLGGEAPPSQPAQPRGTPFAGLILAPTGFHRALPGLHDLGVADVNGDGNLDVFAARCTAPQSPWLGDGHGGFHEAPHALTLRQHVIPGAEDVAPDPPPGLQGLLVGRRPQGLTFMFASPSGVPPACVEIQFPFDAEVIQAAETDVHVASQSPEASLLVGRIRPGGELVVRSSVWEAPMQVSVDPSVALASIHVGPHRVHPATHAFRLAWRDRHAMAWADVDANGLPDVFIANGAFRGRLRTHPDLIADELLLGEATGYAEGAIQAGIKKDICRARAAAWLDVDGDSLLDLWVGCLDGPNQLHRQVAPGRFANVASEIGLAQSGTGPFYLLDVEDDGDVDLLLATFRDLWLYRNEGAFVAERLGAAPIRSVSAGDIDGDGDLDVLAIALLSNRLFRNDAGTLRPEPVSDIGLPASAVAGCLVDIDRDGRLDLLTIPGGLYRQDDRGCFVSEGQVVDVADVVRAIWFDADNDGDHDLLLTRRNWNVELYLNHTPGGHWLEVELVGPPGNRPAVGAMVMARTRTATQVRQVGGTEGSRYSQGLYRMTFGLGGEDRVESLGVRWPDGAVTIRHDVPADQLLRVHREDDELSRGCFEAEWRAQQLTVTPTRSP